MVLFRRRLLEVECLENRLTPSTFAIKTPLVADSTPQTNPAPVITPISPLTSPVNSANTTVVATVTGMDTPQSGLVFNITVSGLTPQNVQPLGTISFTLNGKTYDASPTPQPDGDYTLYVASGIDVTGISVGSQVVISIGNGGQVLPPPPVVTDVIDSSDPQPAVTPIDPTVSPTSTDATDTASLAADATVAPPDTTIDTSVAPDGTLTV
jgi:hypothetical protein